uniref:Teretoxin Tan15.2 n=1 Tax=Terebra anilis TaxID=553697 RepID=TF2_TERAN|nr:RecName: Full=Teretoxin Tan15.2; Flags: Precursor [Terebra anilis]
MTRLTVVFLAILVLLPLATSNSGADEAPASLSDLLHRTKRCAGGNQCTTDAECCGNYQCRCSLASNCSGSNPKKRCT